MGSKTIGGPGARTRPADRLGIEPDPRAENEQGALWRHGGRIEHLAHEENQGGRFSII
jgi:hypothetical protein